MNTRLIALLSAFAAGDVPVRAYREKDGRVLAQRKAKGFSAPLLVPLWIAMGIVGTAAMLPFYGPAAWALPALAFLVACPLLVTWVLFVEGGDAPET
ncbi:MAG: hypothetical protein Q7V31_16420 [Parvibaculum sp.]|uniref:hypothetical protein n=1 Tax=Parvibaculum sp. TaxID=2024848 RepID=UPI002718B492|nr:hypothetical protein [Parvibaculum sp.]MDO8840500.1 hypothetical protein [Parvibaculum sp.]